MFANASVFCPIYFDQGKVTLVNKDSYKKHKKVTLIYGTSLTCAILCKDHKSVVRKVNSAIYQLDKDFSTIVEKTNTTVNKIMNNLPTRHKSVLYVAFQSRRMQFKQWIMR